MRIRCVAGPRRTATDPRSQEEVLDEFWPPVFEAMLEGWLRSETLWPSDRTRTMFDEWFEIQMCSLVQDLYLDGKRAEAMAEIPDEMVDEVALIGSKERIRDNLEAWRDSGVTTIVAMAQDLTTLRTMAELLL